MWKDAEETELDPSLPHLAGSATAAVPIQRFHLEVVEGPSGGRTWNAEGDRCAIGSHVSNDLVLEDRTVSRFHCEIRIDPSGARVQDLGSRNATLIDGVRVADAWLRDGSLLRLGQSVVRFHLDEGMNALRVSADGRFGTMIGDSVPMRAAFALLERAAASDITVLIEGETGTGKEEAAVSIHERSPRAGGPFVVIDCSAIPANLLESELFGHERGAFTGAVERRIGAFEAANGGTVFIDEVGELPTALQPKLLRVLERRTIRRLGSHDAIPVDLRIVAATNRNLRSEVNEGRFRSDLYYRLAVVKVTLPPLRERADDVPGLVRLMLDSLGAAPDVSARLLDPGFLARLQHAAWPGNVRELRNYLEQCMVLHEPPPIAPPRTRQSSPAEDAVDPRLSYAEAKRRLTDEAERRYLEALLRHHDGNVSQAARAAGMNRGYLHRLLRRHGIRGE